MMLRTLAGRGIRAAREFAPALGSRPFRLALGLSVIAHGALFLALSQDDLFRVAPPEPLLRGHLMELAADTRVVRRQPAAKKPATSSKHTPPLPKNERSGLPEPPIVSSSPAPQASECPAGPETTAKPSVPEAFVAGTALEAGDQGPAPGAARGSARQSAAEAVASPAAEAVASPAEGAVASPAGMTGGAGSTDAARAAGPPAPSPGDLAALHRRIDARKVYPQLAVRNGWEGRVLVEMRLGGDGSLAAVRLLQGSGYAVLDEATLAAVRRAAPFPPVACVVAVPVEFRLVP